MFALATSRVDASCGANQYLNYESGVVIKSTYGGVACYGNSQSTVAFGTNYCYWSGGTCNQHWNHAPSSRCKKFSEAVAASWLTCKNKAQCDDSILCADTQIVDDSIYCSTDTCGTGDDSVRCCRDKDCDDYNQEWIAECACTVNSVDCLAKKSAWTTAGCTSETCG